MEKAASKITRQLEFYFSPANLRRDQFMQQQLREHECLKLETLLKFNRVKSLIAEALPDNQDDTEAMLNLLRDCVRASEVLTLCGDEDAAVKTVEAPQLPADASVNGESAEKATASHPADDCVLMVQQLPSNASLDDLLEYFGGLNGEQGVVLVQMRRSKADGKFLGSAWVEFRDAEAAEAFVKRAEETEGGLIMQGSQLVVSRKAEFKKRMQEKRKPHIVGALLAFELPENTEMNMDTRDLISGMKKVLREQCKLTPQYIDYPLNGDKQKGLIRFPQEKMGESAFEALSGTMSIPKLNSEELLQLTVRVPVDEEETEFWAAIKKARATSRDEPPKEVERTYPENHFLRLEFSAVGKDAVSQAFIEKELSQLGRIRFLDYCRPPLGETEAVVRFQEPVAKTICEQLGGKLGGVTMSEITVLEGEDNKKVWDVIYDRQQANLQTGQKRGKNQQGGRRGGKRHRVGR